MKKIIYIPVLLFMTALTMVSCDGLLNANSEQYTFDEQYRMGSENDSLYAFVGILSKLQRLGDRYVLLGELRGDLMETGDDASRFLKEINDFNVSKENPYAKTSDYYDVINNCNYVIQYVDSTKSANGIKYNIRVKAMAKSIRAWTYLQLVLNYGSAKYITKPILDEEDVTVTYPTVGLYDLCGLLINDLRPYYQTENKEDIGSYFLGNFGNFNTKSALFPIRFLLGDLYLWKGSILEGQNDITAAKANYENAAIMYYNLMVQGEFNINRSFSSSWEFDNLSKLPTVIPGNKELWPSIFAFNNYETITALASSAEYGNQFILDSLSFNQMIVPTPISIANWDNQVYASTIALITDGDLRKRGSVSTEYRNSENKTFRFDKPIITKFLRTGSLKEKMIYIYRNSHLYLRYAEAVNRLGCSKLAFATLKNGLNSDLELDTVIQNEIAAKFPSSYPSYMMFSASVFSFIPENSTLYSNVGMHSRGCGPYISEYTYNITKTSATPADTVYYRIPYGVVNAAAVEYVEDKIVEELALETAYEGNRFHDLMRIAIRRGDPAYLADRVSAKYSNSAAMKAILLNEASWYLPR